MAVDWDSVLLGPVHGVFGEPVTYMPARGMPFPIDGVFDKAYLASDALGDGAPMSTTMPVLGVRLALFPAGAQPVQGTSSRSCPLAQHTRSKRLDPMAMAKRNCC